MSNYANVSPPLSPFFPLQTPFAFRGIVREDPSLSCAAYVFVRGSAFLRRNVLPSDDPFLRQQKQRCSSPLSSLSFWKILFMLVVRRSRDIWRFDIDVSVSGFRPPPPPPFFSSFFVHPFLLSFSSPPSPRMNGKGESAADNADKLPSKSLLCVCAPYRSPSLAPFPPSSSVAAAAAVDRPPIESSLQLAFSERAGKRVR